MTETEIVIAKMVVDDSNIPKSCNEYKTIVEALEKQIPKEPIDKMMTEQIKNTERDCENCVFQNDLALSNCRLWECKGTVTIEDAEKAIRSLQAWLEVIRELEKERDFFTSISGEYARGMVFATSEAIDIINQHLEIEE